MKMASHMHQVVMNERVIKKEKSTCVYRKEKGKGVMD